MSLLGSSGCGVVGAASAAAAIVSGHTFISPSLVAATTTSCTASYFYRVGNARHGGVLLQALEPCA